MFEIIHKQILSDDIKRIDILAPQIAEKAKPGHFVSVCPEQGDERIPLSIVDSDSQKGTISLIFQEVGETTGKFGSLPINESVFSILGPLGTPSKIEKVGHVVCLATGVGIAQMLPICKALKKAGNKVIGIIGARTRQKIMLEPQMRVVCDRLFITTDDGTYMRKGLVTDVLKEILAKQEVGFVYAIGSIEMMQEVCSITKSKKIETRVHLNPVMVDCMGTCGSCRVKISGQMMLACTDGPEFDGHQVDFEDFKVRIKAFKESNKCRSLKLPSKSQKKESTILTKFLWAFQKK